MLKVARQYGFNPQVDTELADIALDFLDEAVQDMNSHLYEFNKRSETVSLTDGTSTYTLSGGSAESTTTPVIPYKESIAYLDHLTSTDRINLVYIPWVRFAEYVKNRVFAGTGEPELYSFRNIENDGTVTLYPTPGGTADTHVLVLEYYIRIPLISILANDATSPRIPEEVEVPLLYNAMKRMATHLYGPGHPDVGGFDVLEQRSLGRLQAVDKRHPDQNLRFQLVDNVKRGTHRSRRALYIKV